MNNYEEAKQLYLKYNGNFFHMDREGDYEKYSSFDVPKELEKQWNKEIKKDLINKINIEKNQNNLRCYIADFLTFSMNNEDISGLVFINNLLTKNSNNYDTYTLLLIINSIFTWDVDFAIIDKEKTLSILNKSLETLKGLKANNITISKDYFDSKTGISYGLTTKIVAEYIEKDIGEYTKKLNYMDKRISEYLYFYKKLKKKVYK